VRVGGLDRVAGKPKSTIERLPLPPRPGRLPGTRSPGRHSEVHRGIKTRRTQRCPPLRFFGFLAEIAEARERADRAKRRFKRRLPLDHRQRDAQSGSLLSLCLKIKAERIPSSGDPERPRSYIARKLRSRRDRAIGISQCAGARRWCIFGDAFVTSYLSGKGACQLIRFSNVSSSLSPPLSLSLSFSGDVVQQWCRPYSRIRRSVKDTRGLRIVGLSGSERAGSRGAVALRDAEIPTDSWLVTRGVPPNDNFLSPVAGDGGYFEYARTERHVTRPPSGLSSVCARDDRANAGSPCPPFRFLALFGPVWGIRRSTVIRIVGWDEMSAHLPRVWSKTKIVYEFTRFRVRAESTNRASSNVYWQQLKWGASVVGNTLRR